MSVATQTATALRIQPTKFEMSESGSEPNKAEKKRYAKQLAMRSKV